MFKSQFFQEGTGQLSMMRLVMFLIVAAVLLVWLALNGAMIVKAALDPKAVIDMVDFKPQAMIVLGMAIAGKVTQAITEVKEKQE